MTAQEAALKAALVRIVSNQAVGVLIKKLPLFAFGPLGSIAGLFISWVLSFLLDETILGVHLFLINHEINSEVVGLKAAIEKAKGLSPDATVQDKDKVDQELIRAANELIKMKGAV